MLGLDLVAYKSTEERKREREEDLTYSCVGALLLASEVRQARLGRAYVQNFQWSSTVRRVVQIISRIRKFRMERP